MPVAQPDQQGPRRPRRETARQRLLRRASTLPLDLEPGLPEDLDSLRQQALRHRNNRYSRGDEHLRVRMEDTNPRTLNRWFVNFLRHRHTRYDHQVNRIGSGASRRDREEAIQTIRDRICQLIAQKYPQLADECRRQMNRHQNHRPR